LNDAARFDRHPRYEEAVEEAIAFAGQEHSFYLEAKARRLLELSQRHLGRRPVRALDVGAGIGLIDRLLLPHVTALAGVDVSGVMVERAREMNPGVEYQIYDQRLPYGDGEFDIVFAVCVLHHVDAADRAPLLAEMARVTNEGGLTVIFEHNPLNPLTRRVVRTCVFDEGVELLPRRELARLFRAAQLLVVEEQYLLFFPWRSRVLAQLERGLNRLPFGAQYVVAGQHPSGDPSPGDKEQRQVHTN
jgi:SAM-dependent methyltransferase